MEPQTTVRWYRIAKYIGIGVFIFIVGIAIGVLKVVPRITPLPCVPDKQGVSATIESDVNAMTQAPDGTSIIFGVVSGVEGNRITLRLQTPNQLKDNSLNNYTVLISSETKIFKLSQKDSKVFQDELVAFTKITQAEGSVAPETIKPPEPFTRIPATVADIMVGSGIIVTTLGNTKIMNEISATEIKIQSKINNDIPAQVTQTVK